MELNNLEEQQDIDSQEAIATSLENTITGAEAQAARVAKRQQIQERLRRRQQDEQRQKTYGIYPLTADPEAVAKVMDIPKGAVAGVLNAAESMKNLAIDLVGVTAGDEIEPNVLDIMRDKLSVKGITPKTKTAAGKVVESITQFATGFVPVGQASRAAGVAKAAAKVPKAIKAAAKDPQNASFEFLYKDGDVKAVDLRGGDEAVAEVNRLLGEGWTDKAPPTGGDFGTSIMGRSLGLFETDEDVQALEDYFAGIETPETRAAGRAYSVISAHTIDPITRRESAAVVPEYIQAAKTRGERRRGELTRQLSEGEATDSPVTAGATPESTKGPTGTFYDDVPPPPEKTKRLTAADLSMVGISDPESLTGEALEAYQGNLEKGTGLPSGPVAFAEYLVAQGSDIMNIPLSTSNQGNARARDARRVLLGIQQRIKDFILEDDDRPLAQEYTNILDQMPNPSAFTDDEDMYRSIEKWRNYVIDEVLFAQEVIARGEDFAKAKDTTVNKSQNRRDAALTKVLPILNAAL